VAQVERAALFTHSAFGQSFHRIGEAEEFVHGLIDVLLSKGVLTAGEITEAVGRVRQELTDRGELNGPGTIVRSVDAQEPEPVVKVDCAARMHICHAVCCSLDFALSVEELDSGNVKWDLGRPYFIRHRADGSCVHKDLTSGRCGVYADRPGVCRSYSCANDPRIWNDFDKMELNTEWIDANLLARPRPRVFGALMHGQHRLVEVPGNETDGECEA
jgi:Fe-S-cluster containining protein